MKIFLDRIKSSLKHLELIDQIFSQFDHSQKSTYNSISSEIDAIDNKWRDESVSFSEQLYVGGKRIGKNGYSRQMILADILEYIITGRAYYFFLSYTNDPNAKEKASDFIIFLILLIVSNIFSIKRDGFERNLRIHC